jgi:hypothetical protein
MAGEGTSRDTFAQASPLPAHHKSSKVFFLLTPPSAPAGLVFPYNGSPMTGRRNRSLLSRSLAVAFAFSESSTFPPLPSPLGSTDASGRVAPEISPHKMKWKQKYAITHFTKCGSKMNHLGSASKGEYVVLYRCACKCCRVERGDCAGHALSPPESHLVGMEKA